LTLPLARSYKLIALHELFFGMANRILLNLPNALSRLGQRRKVPGVPGRPTQRETTKRLRLELMAAGEWPSKRSAQVTLIRQRWLTRDLETPKPKTIENQLRLIEADERDPKSP
jgi:hypothetical protein